MSMEPLTKKLVIVYFQKETLLQAVQLVRSTLRSNFFQLGLTPGRIVSLFSLKQTLNRTHRVHAHDKPQNGVSITIALIYV